jgi:hypothetical protein
VSHIEGGEALVDQKMTGIAAAEETGEKDASVSAEHQEVVGVNTVRG